MASFPGKGRANILKIDHVACDLRNCVDEVMAGFRDGHRGWTGRGARQILTAAIVAAPLLAAAPAVAQWFADDPMPPGAAARIAARHGFTGLSAPRLAGDVYIVQAIDEDGARVRLVIDAYSGRLLRPRGASVEFAPPRPGRRLRPWDYTPDDEEDEEPAPVERFGDRRWSRETLVPPRPIGRERPPELPLSREAEIDLDREPAQSFRPAPVERERRPSEARSEPTRRAARIDPSAPEATAPAQAARPRGTSRALPSAPAPAVETPAPPAASEAGKKPDATAALPTPNEEPAPASAPRAAAEERPDKPSPTQAPAVRQQPAPAKQPPAQRTATQAETPNTATGAPGKVRVIGGVAPVVPQKPGSEEGATSEPSKIAQ
jgi:hypothetical protein